MFLGQHFSKLKESNHVSLPANWEKLISGGVFLTQGFDQNLLILTEDTFNEIYQRVTSLNIADPLARLLSRMFLGKAVFSELDHDKGAISLPSNLVDYAGLKDEIVLVGQGNYLEIWSPERWEQQQSDINDAQANAQRFSNFVIATR
ncbi:MAG: hypothetical protein HZB50_15680 [Chloroflexi bacterium]|nr:hypothetical protein [Chloroflexota bacterium]